MNEINLSPASESLQPKGFPPLPKGWVAENDQFTSCDGKTTIVARLFHKENWNSPRAMVILHGMGEHGGRYLHFPHYLGSEIEAFYCIDHLGHGRSGGIRGHVNRFDDLTQDSATAVRRMADRLSSKFGKSEIHLLGHSLGGHIALRVLFLHPDLPLSSAVISAPFLGIAAKVPAIKIIAAKLLKNIVPTLGIPTGIKLEDLSHDAAVVEAYRADPLTHDKMTPGFFYQLQLAFGDTMSRTSGILKPCLFLVPTDDRLVDEQRALEFYKNLQAAEKTLNTYDGFFHEPHNELGKEKVFADVAQWISAH